MRYTSDKYVGYPEHVVSQDEGVGAEFYLTGRVYSFAEGSPVLAAHSAGPFKLEDEAKAAAQAWEKEIMPNHQVKN